MDLTSITSQSPKILAVIESLKNDPNFIEEFKANPHEALSKIGIELNEEELSYVQKLEELQELESAAEGIIAKIRALFNFK